jgi:uncharacterized protein YjbI with pentapeptide repeats
MKRASNRELTRNLIPKQNPGVWLLALLVLVGLLLAVWKIPQQQVGTMPLKAEEKARIDAETSARVALIQGIGGFLVFVTAGVSWLNLKATQRNVLIAEEKQITERFSKAVELLSSNSIHSRLGGIYALERISRDSARDYWQVMELLTAFVREKTRTKNKGEPFHIIDYNADITIEEGDEYYEDDLNDADEWNGIIRKPNHDYIYRAPVDIQAVLTALGRRLREYENNEDHSLDLSWTDLRGVVLTGDFTGINFESANLQGAKLANANLAKAKLTKANMELARFEMVDFQEADLENAQLAWTRFQSTNLRGANLNHADLNEAHLWNTDLIKASLQKVDLTNAILEEVNLERADLSESSLCGSVFKQTDFSQANLSGADLRTANFSSALNLTSAQIKSAEEREGTLYSSELKQKLE